MAAPIKKIRKNKPFRNARGQYNFCSEIDPPQCPNLNTNLSLYPHIDEKFLNKDLYSINEGDDTNEAILDIDENILTIGTGNSKKKAEQDAAHNALIHFNILD